jgi:hypothetical protein
VLLALTVPAEYSTKEMAIMRRCVYDANLIEYKNSEKLQFVVECKWILEIRALLINVIDFSLISQLKLLHYIV